MPDDIEAIMNRVAATMPAVQWASPAEIRGAAQSHRQRQIVVGLLAAVIGVGGGSAVFAAADMPPHSNPAAQCPDGLVPASLALPDTEQIRLNILNGTTRSGLATEIAEDLRMRQFRIAKITDAASASADVAVIRYGPRAVGAAWVMRSYFLDEAAMEFDLSRGDDVVDIVLGEQFQSLATRTEVNQSIAALGRAIPPEGTCEAD